MKDKIQLVGDIASIVMIPALGLCWYMITSAIHTSRIESESSAKDIYVQKATFNDAVRSLVDTDNKLSEILQRDHITIEVIKQQKQP